MEHWERVQQERKSKQERHDYVHRRFAFYMGLVEIDDTYSQTEAIADLRAELAEAAEDAREEPTA